MDLQSIGRTAGIALLALLVAVPGSAAAQSQLAAGQGFEELPRLGIGYVTNAPNIFTGASAYGILDVLGGLGLYADVKFSASSPADEPSFVDTLTTQDVDLEVEEDGFGWLSLNAALVRPLTPELMIYLGAGYTFEEVYRRHFEPVEDIGDFGWFWAHDPEASGGSLNVLGGAFFRMGRNLVFQFGLESRPRGFTVGASYSFSLR